MTKDDIQRMAQEAGIVVTGEAVWKLCQMVIAAEREACARACEANDEIWPDIEWGNACHACAEDIRARGET